MGWKNSLKFTKDPYGINIALLCTWGKNKERKRARTNNNLSICVTVEGTEWSEEELKTAALI